MPTAALMIAAMISGAGAEVQRQCASGVVVLVSVVEDGDGQLAAVEAPGGVAAPG